MSLGIMSPARIVPAIGWRGGHGRPTAGTGAECRRGMRPRLGALGVLLPTCSAWAQRSLDQPDELRGRDAQLRRQPEQGLEGGTPFTPFQLAHEGPATVSGEPERLLGKTPAEAKLPEHLPERLVDGEAWGGPGRSHAPTVSPWVLSRYTQ